MWSLDANSDNLSRPSQFYMGWGDLAWGPFQGVSRYMVPDSAHCSLYFTGCFYNPKECAIKSLCQHLLSLLSS